MTEFFNQDMSRAYDEKNRRLAPIADGMRFLAGLVLQGLQQDARILCVGVGTGIEILWLAEKHPGWRFVGLDPSSGMLAVCREKLAQAGVMDRCELVEGYVHDLPAGANFDAALSLLVGHFVRKEERAGFYRHLHDRLKPGGCLVDTQISFDLASEAFPAMLKNWARVQELMGATPESLQTLPDTLRDVLTVLPPAQVEAMMRQSGFNLPTRFFQAFMIMGWYAWKDQAR